MAGKPKITDELIEQCVRLLMGGIPLERLGHLVDGISDRTVHRWRSRGKAALQKWEDNPRSRRVPAADEPYVRFYEATERGRARFEMNALLRIQEAGMGQAVRRQRVALDDNGQPIMQPVVRERDGVPVAMTDPVSGEVLLEPVMELDYHPPTWQPNAWLLERRDPDSYGRRTRAEDKKPSLAELDTLIAEAQEELRAQQAAAQADAGNVTPIRRSG